jgi:cytochrome c oxidase subunit 3
MSTVENNVAVAEAPHWEADHDHHDPNLAHHFDTPEQQALTGKLGMWTFLATELLMFGGLFCAYSVYRHSYPEVFEYAHRFLDKKWGAINTIVLITSSLTMAWGVRAAQMGNRKLLMGLLVLTLLGAAGFMGIKSVEYRKKFSEHIFIGSGNEFYHDAAETTNRKAVQDLEEEAFGIHEHEAVKVAVTKVTPLPADPNAGTGDEAKIVPPNITPAGLAPKAEAEALTYDDMHDQDRHRVYTFFAIYFFMTGLHGVHVLVGMGLIFWILVRAASPRERVWIVPAGVIGAGALLLTIGIIAESRMTMFIAGVIVLGGVAWTVLRMRSSASVTDGDGEFGPTYFTPVDLVGLYWHLVDLIWIFLFPLLYLIH